MAAARGQASLGKRSWGGRVRHLYELGHGNAGGRNSALDWQPALVVHHLPRPLQGLARPVFRNSSSASNLTAQGDVSWVHRALSEGGKPGDRARLRGGGEDADEAPGDAASARTRAEGGVVEGEHAAVVLRVHRDGVELQQRVHEHLRRLARIGARHVQRQPATRVADGGAVRHVGEQAPHNTRRVGTRAAGGGVGREALRQLPEARRTQGGELIEPG